MKERLTVIEGALRFILDEIVVNNQAAQERVRGALQALDELKKDSPQDKTEVPVDEKGPVNQGPAVDPGDGARTDGTGKKRRGRPKKTETPA